MRLAICSPLGDGTAAPGRSLRIRGGLVYVIAAGNHSLDDILAKFSLEFMS